MARKKSKGTELSVFKGRKAKLNRAIMQILTQNSPQTIYDIRKQILQTRNLKTTRYANVNTRVKALEKDGYLRKIGLKNTRAGFKAALYEVTSRALFVLLISPIDLDDLILELDEISTLTILSTIVMR
jgi:DNA-binding Lrp family transcriptional regulator